MSLDPLVCPSSICSFFLPPSDCGVEGPPTVIKLPRGESGLLSGSLPSNETSVPSSDRIELFKERAILLYVERATLRVSLPLGPRMSFGTG